MKKKGVSSFLILTALFYLYSVGTASGRIYNFSFFIQGNARGKVFLLIPFRIFYQASSSVDFISEHKNNHTVFHLSNIIENGYMVRTLGFSGKTLAVLVAGNNIEKMKLFSKRIIKNFRFIAPGFSKHVSSASSNFFILQNTDRNTIGFERTENGIHYNIKNSISLKRIKNSSRILNINFNVYKILSEILKIFNHSFLPPKTSLEKLLKSGNREWKSSYINFTDTLIKSSRKAAKIFEKIKGFGQKKPFRVVYRIVISNKNIILIKGTVFPDIPIWNDLKIHYFERKIKIQKAGLLLISDIVKVSVKGDSDAGGSFISYLKLKK